MIGNNAVDFLYSDDNMIYTSWFKTFALWPIKTVSGNRVWFRQIFYRWKTMKYDIPQFPKEHFNKREYATLEEILDRRFRGLK